MHIAHAGTKIYGLRNKVKWSSKIIKKEKNQSSIFSIQYIRFINKNNISMHLCKIKLRSFTVGVKRVRGCTGLKTYCPMPILDHSFLSIFIR